jgi:hypothetical protein
LSGPVLDYQTPEPRRATRLRTPTAILLLLVGGFRCLLGTCVGAAVVAVPWSGRSTLDRWLNLSQGVLVVAATLGCGLVYLAVFWGVAGGKRRATKVALVTALVNIGVAVLVCVIDGVQGPWPEKPVVMPMLPYCEFWVATDATLAGLLFWIVRARAKEGKW